MPSMIGFTGVVDAGFTPSGSPAGHWSANTITGLSDGDPIATWPDQTANGNDLVQANIAAKPTYKIDILNGKPAVRADGTSDYMACVGIAHAQPTTIFLVSQQLDADAGDFLFDGITTRQLYYTAAGTWVAHAGAVLDSEVAVDTDPHIHTLLFKGAASTIRIDGVEQAAGDAGANAMDGLHIFASNTTGAQITMDMFELIFYYSEEDPAANEAGLAIKYGL